ncbi:MAG: enoyl-CoA hydratase-related protein [Actinomycetota bacterium]
MTLETVQLEVDEGLARIHLARPEAGNAVTGQMARELMEMVGRCARDTAIRAVLLTGNGRRFCVGGDLREFVRCGEALPGHLREMTTYLHAAVSRLVGLEVPVVAGVHGAAAGAGLSLACACDMVVAGESTRFRAAYLAIGLPPDGSLSFTLPRLAGTRRALDLVLSNRPFTALEALEWGIVSRVVSDGEVEAEALRLARDLAAGPTRALGAAKRLLRLEAPLETQMEMEARAIVDAAQGDDGLEGIAAFLEKREPHFTGK